jgi:hypothetical protein
VIRSVNASLCECVSQRVGVQADGVLGAETGMNTHEGCKKSEVRVMRSGPAQPVRARPKKPEFGHRCLTQSSDSGYSSKISGTSWTQVSGGASRRSRQRALRTEMAWAVE